jgi:peptidyl-prolyl cis-trans isomerase C
MRRNKFFSFLVFALFLISIAVLPLWAGGKQEKQEKQQADEQESKQESSQQEPSEEESSDGQESEATPIPSGTVDTAAEVAAVVNGVEIPMSRLEQQVRNYQQQMMQRGQQVQGMQLEQLRRQALESIINTEVLYQIASEKGYEASEKQVNSEMDSMKQRFGGDQQFQGALQQQGMSEDSLRENIARYYTIQQFIDEQFAPEVTVRDEEAKTFYEENTQAFKQEEQVRASHILIEVQEDASDEKKQQARDTLEEVQQKLDDGAEFSEMARQYSEGPSAKNGGDLGYFGRNQMVKAFEEKAFSMDPGEVSGIVESRFGYHLIKVTDRKEEQTAPYEEVKDRIISYLEEQRMGENINAYLEEQKNDMDIERTALQGAQE